MRKSLPPALKGAIKILCQQISLIKSDLPAGKAGVPQEQEKK